MRGKTTSDRLYKSNAANAKLRMTVRLLQMKCSALEVKLARWGRPMKQETQERCSVEKMQCELLTPESRGQLQNAQMIQRIVAEKFEISIEQLLAKSRSDRCCVARQVAQLLVNELLGIENGEMGLLFMQSRTNWYHGIKTIKDRMETEEHLRVQVDELRAAVKLKLEDKNL